MSTRSSAGTREANYAITRLAPRIACTLAVPISFALGGMFVAGCGGNAAKGDSVDTGSASDTNLDGSLDATETPELDSSSTLDIGDREPVSLEILPADSKLTVTDVGKSETVSLNCTAIYKDGSRGPVSASWSIDRYDLASIAPGTGVFTTSGRAGGVVQVTAKLGTLVATSKVTIELSLTKKASDIDDGDATSLLGATELDSKVKGFLYPYDKTVFPIGLAGPEVMWNGGSASDTYLLRITGSAITVDIFSKAPAPSVLPLNSELWNTITSTATSGGKESVLQIELRRVSPGGVAAVSAKATWRIAPANLRGTIYYWAVDRGEVVKITPGATSPVSAFPAGDAATLGSPAPRNAADAPTPPWEAVGSGKRCVACHAVAKDGSRLVATVSTPRGSRGPAGFVDLRAGKLTALSDYKQNVMFQTLTPDGKKSVVNTVEMGLGLVDALTGATIPSALDSFAGKHAAPSFSNDGKSLAFATNIAGGYPVEFTRSDLVTFDWDDSTNKFTGLKTIVAGAPAKDAMTFPSFSPDSKWIFFQRGDYSRAKYGDGVTSYLHGNADLYAVENKVGASPIALEALNGIGSLTGDNMHLNYQPTVNPIAEGGYFWVVFVTPRDYGNKMVSPQKAPPADCSWSNRKQLWVAAVDASMTAKDPSHPAFRLPGQLLETINMNGYWTLSPCVETPKDGTVASCSAGFECCSGFCRDVGGVPSCVDKPGDCHKISESCAKDSDCCGDATCIGGFCGPKLPK